MPLIFIMMLVLVEMLAINFAAAEPAPNPMTVGVDDAGSRKYIYDDPIEQEAFEQIGFDFLMHHFWGEPTVQDIDKLDSWAAEHGHGFFINQENSTSSKQPGDPAIYDKPGGFFQPPREYVDRCLATPRFLGYCFDECEHWINNGNSVTGGGAFEPHFYDAEGDTLDEAYAGNLKNLQILMAQVFPGFAERAHKVGQTPIVGTESVFPDLQHLFARAGLVQMPKLLKETITPVTLAMAMGAAKQYGVQHWTSVDLWGVPGYPGHSPEELRSALLISYWTGAERTYIENFNYEGSLYTEKDNRPKLSAYGEVARDFIRDYLPNNPRYIRFEEFSPEVIIVRFPDSDWGQENPGPWIRKNLYGASNLVPDDDTRYWLKIWHVISHETIPTIAVNYNTPLGIPYCVLFPANNVAVYDHTASDPALYQTAKLVFLTGKRIEPDCMTTLQKLVENGLTVVTTSKLAPEEFATVGVDGYCIYSSGAGQWIVTDDVTLAPVQELVAPYLGHPGELRYVFGDTEVIFTTPEDPAQVQVTVRTP